MNDCFVNRIKNSEMIFKYAKGISEKRGKEFHLYHEILLFLGGNAKFISEEIDTTLQPNTLIVIPKETYHQFIITGNQENYLRCVFNFYDLPELQDIISQQISCLYFAEMTKAVSYLFDKAKQLANSTEKEQTKQVLIHSILSLILTELSPIQTVNKKSADMLSARVISYLTDHLCDSLTIETIAKKLNVSPSCLSHSFKKEIGISLYHYLLEKRLILAKQKIMNGESAKNAALECGFHDYSGFYKQYKKMFSSSPSSNTRDISF